MLGKGKASRPFVSNIDPTIEALLKAQRDAVGSAFEWPSVTPRVGDVWISHAHWNVGTEDGLAAMLVVLRAFNEVWSSQPLFDVAPVSEDERLATEWSLVLSANDSGVGLPLVVHVDVQTTTTSAMLSRRLGCLADAARDDLLSILRAYALGDISAIEFQVGRSGTVSIRFHPEWDDFVMQLVALSREFAAPLEAERRKVDSANDSSDVEGENLRWLRVAATNGPAASRDEECGEWEYRDVAPFVYCHGTELRTPPLRLGEAVACYYTSDRASGRTQGTPQHLDSETFHRIEPFFNLPLSGLIDRNEVSDAFRDVVGVLAWKSLSIIDKQVIVASIRCAKIAAGRKGQLQPMRLAARRPTKE